VGGEAQGDDRTAKVRNWLNGQGAPFEMLTAKSFAQPGTYVQQGRYVIDPDTGKSREVDVVAGKQTVLVDNGIVGVWACVECKYARAKPWVLYRDAHAYWESHPIFDRITTVYGEEWLHKVQFINEVRESPLWISGRAPAYGIGTAQLGSADPKEGDSDQAWAALWQVTQAARALAKELSYNNDRTVFGAVLPVLAIRGRLFETWLDGEDNLAVAEVDQGQVRRSDPAAGEHAILVDVVTEVALESYAAQFAAGTGVALEHGKEAARGINTTGIY
jgi:hypothetical protein